MNCWYFDIKIYFKRHQYIKINLLEQNNKKKQKQYPWNFGLYLLIRFGDVGPTSRRWKTLTFDNNPCITHIANRTYIATYMYRQNWYHSQLLTICIQIVLSFSCIDNYTHPTWIKHRGTQNRPSSHNFNDDEEKSKITQTYQFRSIAVLDRDKTRTTSRIELMWKKNKSKYKESCLPNHKYVKRKNTANRTKNFQYQVRTKKQLRKSEVLQNMEKFVKKSVWIDTLGVCCQWWNENYLRLFGCFFLLLLWKRKEYVNKLLLIFQPSVRT